MFQWLPWSDRLTIRPASIYSLHANANFNVSDALTLPVSSIWRSANGRRANINFELESSVAPGVFAIINTIAFPGQRLTLQYAATRGTASDFNSRARTEQGQRTDPLIWNRIQHVETGGGNTDGEWTLLLEDPDGAASHMWQVGSILVAERWRTAELPASVNISSDVPQLQTGSETGTPILGRPAGRRRRVNISWTGDLFGDTDMRSVLEMLDFMENRQEAALIRPGPSPKEFLFFGRLNSWSVAGQENSPERINASFLTDGLGQVIV